ncbi:MAG: MBL fold metallo-hydrolase, partial [Crocinitomicaceae bacterium]
MQITKINEDSTWLLHLDGLKVLIDPWLSPSQIDFHPWFSRQFHNQPQVAIETLPQPDFIFISHPFTDHCNKETLMQFATDTPIVAPASVLKKIQKWQHFNTLLSLDKVPFTLRQLKTKRALVHKAFQISSKEKSLIYAPHGAVLSENSHANVLITTT